MVLYLRQPTLDKQFRKLIFPPGAVDFDRDEIQQECALRFTDLESKLFNLCKSKGAQLNSPRDQLRYLAKQFMTPQQILREITGQTIEVHSLY